MLPRARPASMLGPLLILAAAALSGCSGSNGGVSTASVLGTAPTPPSAADGASPASVAAVPSAAPSTPTDRAFQVGAVSARAVKCGYNFDGPKLKAAYMAHEIGVGASNEDIGQIEKVYQVAYNGVIKAAAEESNYCSERRTNEIKGDLNRLLAGDFEPPRRTQAAAKKDEGGLFDGWFDGSDESSGPKFGSGDWWESQKEKVGG